MKELKVNQNLIPPGKLSELPRLCPFNAIDVNDQVVEINAACRMCGLCVKNGPPGVFLFQDPAAEKQVSCEKSDWKGIAVYIDQVEGEFHPVGFELIGKARELARKADFKVYALCIGHEISRRA